MLLKSLFFSESVLQTTFVALRWVTFPENTFFILWTHFFQEIFVQLELQLPLKYDSQSKKVNLSFIDVSFPSTQRT